MKILITNDDGIDAPGIALLEEVARGFGDVIVVAPTRGFSGCGHLTNTHQPIACTRQAEQRYAIDGSPADCARVGLLEIASDVDWVLSGVNDGGNLGVDVYMSGTVAAAREAALLGKPALAISQYRKSREPFDWSKSADNVKKSLEFVFKRTPNRWAFWNINLPDLEPSETAEIIEAPLELHPLAITYERNGDHYHYRGVYQQRQRTTGGDVDVCFGGKIAATLVQHRG